MYQSLKMIKKRMQGLHLVDSWRPGEPFAGLPKCVEGAGHKEVSCVGLRWPARTARAAQGGVGIASLAPPTPPLRSSCSVVWEPAHGR